MWREMKVKSLLLLENQMLKEFSGFSRQVLGIFLQQAITYKKKRFTAAGSWRCSQMIPKDFGAVIKESSVRSGHKTLRTFMKRSSLWYLPGEISSQMLGLTDELPVRTWNRHRAAGSRVQAQEQEREIQPGQEVNHSPCAWSLDSGTCWLEGDCWWI